MNKNLDILHGEEIDKFLDLMIKVIEILSTKLEPTKTTNSLIKVPKYCPKIDQLLRISIVKHPVKYELDIVNF